jgi:hypothetical protein
VETSFARRYVVGVEPRTSPNAERLLHAVPDSGEQAPPGAAALCGYPRGDLTLVPDIDWGAMDSQVRCQECRDITSQAAAEVYGQRAGQR